MLIVPFCLAAVECPELSEPRDGTISTRIHTFGTRVTFSCDETYAYTGSVTRVCESSGQWSGSEGECIGKISCF